MGVVVGRGSGGGTANGAGASRLTPRLGLSLKFGVAASETWTLKLLVDDEENMQKAMSYFENKLNAIEIAC